MKQIKKLSSIRSYRHLVKVLESAETLGLETTCRIQGLWFDQSCDAPVPFPGGKTVDTFALTNTGVGGNDQILVQIDGRFHRPERRDGWCEGYVEVILVG